MAGQGKHGHCHPEGLLRTSHLCACLPAQQLGREVSVVQRQVQADSGAGDHFSAAKALGITAEFLQEQSTGSMITLGH